MAKISVIIPVYNTESYIASTIRSVLDQNMDDYELIIVNDGSTDNTTDVIRNTIKGLSQVKLIDQKNQGVSVARNNGFRASKGDYVAFLDSDDVWVDNNLKLKSDYLDANPDVGLVHSDAEVIDEKSVPTNEIKTGKEGNIFEDLLLWNGTCIPAPSSILVRREVIQKVGDFDTNLSTSADKDFFFRVAKEYQIGRVPQVTWQYRIHQNNMHSNISVMEKDELYTYNKAKKNGYFKSSSFRRKCFSKMYWVLSGSWWGDGGNFWKAAYFGIRAILVYPKSISTLISKF